MSQEEQAFCRSQGVNGYLCYLSLGHEGDHVFTGGSRSAERRVSAFEVGGIRIEYESSVMRVGPGNQVVNDAIAWLIQGPDGHAFDEQITLADLRTIVSRTLAYTQTTAFGIRCTHFETEEKCWAYGGHVNVEGMKAHRVCLKPRFHDDSHVYDVHPAPAESDYHFDKDPGTLPID